VLLVSKYGFSEMLELDAKIIVLAKVSCRLMAMKSFKTLLNEAFPSPIRLAKNLRTLSEKLGQRRSIGQGRPVDSEGNSIPWYTYPAIEFLRHFDFTSCSVFEFGAGNSSQYWASRTKRVVSVESDPNWFASLNVQIGTNRHLS
jgi:hypothetical protein